MTDETGKMLAPFVLEATPARALRESLRDQARDSARLRMLQGASLKLALETNSNAFLHENLALACQFSGLESGAILKLAQGRLQIDAARGDALPVGSSFGVQGTFAKTMQEGWCIRQRVVSRLCLLNPPLVAIEIQVIIRTRGHKLGILAIFGKRAYSPPDAADRESLQALAAVLGSIWTLPPHQANTPINDAANTDAAENLALLTPREQQVLGLLPRGLSNQQLAVALGIGAGTVKSHIERILHKLALKDRTQAAVRAVQWGLH